MNSFWISFNAVVPMFCIIFLGMYFKKKEYLSEKAVLQMNKLTFVCFTPVLIFKNIYTSGGLSALHPSLMIFTAIAVLAVFAFAVVTVMAIEKSPKKRGAMIQAIFRSNFTLFGVPLAVNLFGEDMGSVPSLLISIVIPIYNVLAVIILEIFRGGEIHVKKIIINIFKNPYLQAAVLGVIFMVTGIKLPGIAEKVVKDLASVSVPLALIVLGASFRYSEVKKSMKQLVFTTAMKLAFVPALLLSAAIAFGFRGIDLGSILAVFASPTPIGSYAMTVQMDSDADLTAGIIVSTTLGSCITLFIFIFGLSYFGLL